MKTGVLTAMIFTLMIGFPIASMAGLAPDADGDGVPDVLDNCDQFANAGAAFCDTDSDGYGNACDGDLNQNNVVNGKDLNAWNVEFAGGGNLIADIDCNNIINSKDLNRWNDIFSGARPFSSGLSCASTVPCD